MQEFNINEHVHVMMIFLRGVFNRKKSANERVKRDEWAQQCGDASLLNAKHYNGTFAAIDFGFSVAIMSALHVRSDLGRERERERERERAVRFDSCNNRDNCTYSI